MKKLFSLLVVAGALTFVACGPSAEDKAKEQAKIDSLRTDSIAKADQLRADSTAAADQKVTDSLAAVKVADSLAALEAAKPAAKPAKKNTPKKEEVKEAKPTRGGATKVS